MCYNIHCLGYGHKYRSGKVSPITLQEAKTLSSDPRIYLIENFLSRSDADRIIQLAQEGLSRAEVSGDEGGEISAGRSGRNVWLPIELDPVISGLVFRISELLHLSIDHVESLQVVHYENGEQYAAHYDSWDLNTPRGQRCTKVSGQRVCTCLLYLNTPEAGGATRFPKLDLDIPAISGNLAVFWNCLTGESTRHPESLHAGSPVTAGEKWACNLWFRERPVPRINRTQRGFSRVDSDINTR